jgi:hypothetical protein
MAMDDSVYIDITGKAVDLDSNDMMMKENIY